MNRRVVTSRQAGFSLIELMVALVLGLILTAGVISVYITSKNTYAVNNALGAVQQHGRFAFTFMDPQIRQAGFTGCKYSSTVGATNNSLNGTYGSDPIYSLVNGSVYGYEATGTGINGSLDINADPTIDTTPPNDSSLWSPDLNTSSPTLWNKLKGTAQGAALKGSDIFLVHEMQGNPPALVGAYDNNTSLFVNTADHDANGAAVNDTSYFSVGMIAMAGDCDGNTHIFKVTALDATAGSITYDSLAPHYANGGNVGPFLTYVYYVGKGVDGGPSLFQGSLDNSGNFLTQELISGIENMQVLYGVGTTVTSASGTTSLSPVNFQTADTIADWTKVISIRVALVARSDDNAVDKMPTATAPFYLLASDPVANANSDGIKFTPPLDRRLRRYFAQTFSLRNSLP